jgi:hypothetical protein
MQLRTWARLGLMLTLCLELSAASAAATLAPYRSEAEFTATVQRWRSQSQRTLALRRSDQMVGMVQSAVPAPAAAPSALKESAGAAADNNITNVQTAGVDEGGIVKRAGDYLVVLRRGRLFTVRVGGDQLQPVARVEAYAPGSDPRGAWYDELLVSGSQVVVIGYSYARGGTEVGLFELGEGGSLAYRATYHLRSFDYYSSRNYASRLVGRKLLFYTPTLLQPWDQQPLAQLMPAMRRWHGAVPDEFERILPATRIYRTDDEFSPDEPLVLHTVTACELGDANLRCEASAVLGPAGRVFYVSAGSVYVWTTSAGRRRMATPEDRTASQPLSAVFRIPLDGSAPSGLKTAGVPIDQMSFLEDGQGELNVLLREQGAGEGMWAAEHGGGAMALLRVPLSDFGDGRGAARREQYRRLPGPAAGPVQNRFVGAWLLWGGGDAAWALPHAQAGAATPLEPGHGIERIEALGEHALLVGQRGADLHFSAVRLGRAQARLAGRHVQPGASQGETRTHGFFYRSMGADEGLLGLPVLGATPPQRPGGLQGGQGAAAVVLLRQRGLSFSALGALSASGGGRADDGCKASCVDWYGNARPIFLGERVLALMGYEIVEGRLDSSGWRERIEERRRISFAPQPHGRGSRPTPFE